MMDLPQWELPDRYANKIGGFRVMLAQTQWYFSLPQFLTIVGFLLYQNSKFVRSLPIIGESIWHWFGFMFLSGISILVIHYAIVYPSMQTFNQNQAQRKERSPHYRLSHENNREIKEIKQRLELAENGEIECPICSNQGGINDGS